MDYDPKIQRKLSRKYYQEIEDLNQQPFNVQERVTEMTQKSNQGQENFRILPPG